MTIVPFTNDSGIDLSALQICSPDQKCPGCELPSFLYACIQSKMFSDSELQFIHHSIETGLDVKDLKRLANELKCHFSVKSLDPNVTDHKKQLKTLIDTRTCETCRDIPLERHVPLVLILGHYVLNTRVFATTYYVKHKSDLDQKYPEMNMTVRQRIRTIGKDGRPRFSTDGTSVVNLLRNLFEHHLLRPTVKPDPEPSRPSSPALKSKVKPKPVKGGKNKKEPKKPSRLDTTVRVPIHRSPPVTHLSTAALEDSDEMSSDGYEIEDVLE